MKTLRAWTLLGAGLLSLLFCQVAQAHGGTLASHVTALTLSSPPGPQDDSIRGRIKACLLMGDMQCIVDQYLLLKNMGRMPGWLVSFQNAFSVANRRAGECEKVARAIHQGLRELAQEPVCSSGSPCKVTTRGWDSMWSRTEWWSRIYRSRRLAIMWR